MGKLRLELLSLYQDFSLGSGGKTLNRTGDEQAQTIVSEAITTGCVFSAGPPIGRFPFGLPLEPL